MAAELGKKNIEVVQKALADWQSEGTKGYMKHCHPDFHGSVLAGIIPGGDKIENLQQWSDMGEKFGDYCDIKKFEAEHWGHSNDGEHVYFVVNWNVTWKVGPFTGQTWDTTANVRKHIKDGKIFEKMHCINMPIPVAADSKKCPGA